MFDGKLERASDSDELILIPGRLKHWWRIIEPDLQEVVDKGRGHSWLEDIYHEISNGQALLYIAMRGESYEGFVILKPLASEEDKTLFVWCVSAPRIFDEGFEKVKEIGRQMGARKICFSSPKEAFQRWAPRKGFEISTVIYQQVIEHHG